MKTRDLRPEVQMLQALADETRLRLLACLLERPACVCELVQATGLAQPRISRHLKILRDAGLVEDERAAQWVEYAVVSPPGYTPAGQILAFAKKLVAKHPLVAADRQALAKATRDQCPF